jgi:phenylacetate-CoA ligase
MFLSKQIETDLGEYPGKSLKAINTTGSTLHEKDRAFIEKCFNAKIFDSYSCEGGANYYQCSSYNNYHPAEEYAISEFIADKYSLSDPEHPQRHITTDLHNYACPFIRYDTQDYVVLGAEETCSCGRKYKNIEKIKGRDTDILISPSGKFILMENILGYFEDSDKISKQILQVQVVQEQIDKIIFNMVVNDNYSNETQKEIYKYWHNFIGSDVDVIVKVVDEIKLTSGGKRRTVIRNPDIRIT